MQLTPPPRPQLNRARNYAATAAIGYGLCYLLKSPAAFADPYFSTPKSIMPMHAWGVLFIILGLLSFIAPWLQQARQMPMMLLSLVFAVYAGPVVYVGLTNPDITPTGGISTAIFAAISITAVRDSSPYRLHQPRKDHRGRPNTTTRTPETAGSRQSAR